MALGVHDVERAVRIAHGAGAVFPVLADPDHAVAESYGVYNLLGDGNATPAVFLVDINGKIVWEYVGKDPNDRPNAEYILSEIKGILP